MPDKAQRMMRAVVYYLRHGMVFYYFQLTDILPGMGEYGPINHMFPLTPVALHEGWIEGEERIITAVYRKPDGTPRKFVVVPANPNVVPRVLCFDIRGRPITVAVKITPLWTIRGRAWEVEVPIQDWAEIAVIEY